MKKSDKTGNDHKVVLIVEDDDSVRRSIDISLKRAGYGTLIAENGDQAITALRNRYVHLVLTDLRMPKTDGLELLRAAKVIRPEAEVIVMTAYGTIETAVEAMKVGAYDFIEKPFNRQTLLAIVRKALEKQSLVVENRLLRKKLEGLEDKPLFIGKSRASRGVLRLAEQVAASKATVLIQGKSGTGKGLVAKLTHELSDRRGGPFVHISCAAIPETLLEAELFGYERGAFTGAIARKEGRFEMAAGGSIFLDEVGEAPPSTQVKLLRVLQEGEFERLGGKRTLKSDARVIAATNRNLLEAMQANMFREDLYYRLNVITITLPTLSERTEDIPLLAHHFLSHYARKNGKRVKGVSQDVLDLFNDYIWPGNIRELENVIERAVVISQDEYIDVADLPDELRRRRIPTDKVLHIPIGTSLRETKKLLILETLKHTNGDKGTSAKILGVATRTIYRLLEEEKDKKKN